MTTPTGSIPTKLRKLDEEFQAMFDTVDRIEKTQRTHGQKINRLISDVAIVKTDISTLKTDVSGLKTDVSGLKTDVSGLKTDMVDVKSMLGVIISRLPER